MRRNVNVFSLLIVACLVGLQALFPLPATGLTLTPPLDNFAPPSTLTDLFRINPVPGSLEAAPDVFGQAVIGTVDPGGLTAAFNGISELFTMVGLIARDDEDDDSEKSEQSQKSDKSGKSEKSGKSDRSDRSDKSDKSDKSGKSDKDDEAQDLDITIEKAPIDPDGTTAGAVTDIVVTFKDRDPAVDGVEILTGGTVEVTLDPSFVNTGAAVPNFGVLLQGWPQSPPAPPPDFIWTSTVDQNRITMTLTSDFLVGDFGPGAKQAHLVLFGFQNPSSPGLYPVSIEIRPDPAKMGVLSGSGFVRIIPEALPSVNAVNLFSGPPGPPPPFFNPLYQTVPLGELFARELGFYLWDRDSEPFLGVDVKMITPTHGRLVQNGRRVGRVRIDAPPGARDFAINTFGPSVPMLAFITNVPVGVLTLQFQPDPVITGDYTITLRMKDGNAQQFFVTVVD